MVKAGKYTAKKHVKSNNNEDIIVENLFNPEIDTLPCPPLLITKCQLSRMSEHIYFWEILIILIIISIYYFIRNHLENLKIFLLGFVFFWYWQIGEETNVNFKNKLIITADIGMNKLI